MPYYILNSNAPQSNSAYYFIDGDVTFTPPLAGYYQNCSVALPGGTGVAMTLDRRLAKLKSDFFHTTCGAFFASAMFGQVLQQFQTQVQMIPTRVSYANGIPLDKSYYLLHSLQELDCFDYQNSDYGGKALVLKTVAREGKPRRRIGVIRKLCLDPIKVGEADYFFVAHTLLLYPLISERLRKALIEAGLIFNSSLILD